LPAKRPTGCRRRKVQNTLAKRQTRVGETSAAQTAYDSTPSDGRLSIIVVCTPSSAAFTGGRQRHGAATVESQGHVVAADDSGGRRQHGQLAATPALAVRQRRHRCQRSPQSARRTPSCAAAAAAASQGQGDDGRRRVDVARVRRRRHASATVDHRRRGRGAPSDVGHGRRRRRRRSAGLARRQLGPVAADAAATSSDAQDPAAQVASRRLAARTSQDRIVRLRTVRQLPPPSSRRRHNVDL